jgi:sterol desaturase/sphingolipid hydroxylase (fatty acid hydroxylase superfamily)
MDEMQFQVLRSGALALAAVLAFAAQRVSPYAGFRGSMRTNVGLWLVSGVVTGLACGTCAFGVAGWAEARGFGLLHAMHAPAWLAIVATVAALDLLSYLWHRANHVVPFLWRFHHVHHSDRNFTASTALRFHPGELLLSLPIRLAVVAVLGAPVLGVLVFESVFGLANLLEHGDIRLPRDLERRLEGIVVTPALHRFHHSRAGLERDHNFATIFSFWDRLLGTYRRTSSAERIDVGVSDVPRDLGLGEVLLLPALSSSPEPAPSRDR